MAAALVNLYTQQCPKEKPFYFTLNEQLRSGNPSPLWSDAANLLTSVIDCFGMDNFDVVYSGKSSFQDFQKLNYDDYFTFDQFSSTSKNKKTAQCFAKGQYFFEIREVYGFDCSSYSSYLQEDEVLLRPSAEFRVG